MRAGLRRRWVAASLLTAVAAADVAAWLVMARYVSMSRWAAVPDLSVLEPPYRDGTEAELPRQLVGTDPRELLQAVMNSVHSIAPFKERGFEALWEHVRSGDGLLCGGMADLYYHVLKRNGLEARRVGLVRNLFDPFATHQTVEVRVQGRWIIYDPTFNVSFAKEGALLGAQEVKNSLLRDGGRGIRPVFYGEVSYPARLDDYYMHWLPLFDNVFIQDVSSRSLFVLMPPLRYWLGPVAYYEASGNGEPHLHLLNGVYFLVVALVPISTVSIAGLLVLSCVGERWV